MHDDGVSTLSHQEEWCPSCMHIFSIYHAVQAPEPDSNDLSAEEVASVKLFQLNTPSVVNISNIGW